MIASPPAVPPKPARTVQINAPSSPPPARQESHNKALARGTAPPGLYSRKLLEEETAKYKKEQEEANAKDKGAEQPAAADGLMRKWAIRYKAIEKTYTQVETKSGSPRGNPSPRTRKAAAKPEAENSQRAKVIREIIATEEDYVRDMSLLLKLWLEPIAHKKLLDRKFEELNLSAEITLMLQVNNELLARLKTSSDVGAAILKMVLDLSEEIKIF